MHRRIDMLRASALRDAFRANSPDDRAGCSGGAGLLLLPGARSWGRRVMRRGCYSHKKQPCTATHPHDTGAGMKTILEVVRRHGDEGCE